MMIINKTGLLDTIQDLGRYGYQKYGVVASGAMDAWAHRIANIIVGNVESEATLEMTLVGPHILFEQDTLIAVCGGNLQPTIDEEPIPMWKPVYIRKNTLLKFGRALAGCRTYLAVADGFDLPSIMNSKSTYLKAEIGGYNGRPLHKNDELLLNKQSAFTECFSNKLEPIDKYTKFQTPRWYVSPELIPTLSTTYEVRFTRGRQFDLFNKLSKSTFIDTPFTVSSQSDRMGYRLNGPTLALSTPEELISEAVSFGSVQVPPDGNPIILTADRQTTGGYPKIAEIATVDHSLIAQAKPGDQLIFKEITIEQSQNLYIEQEKMLNELKVGVSFKYK